MLSIIISTYQTAFLNALKQNIELSIGIPYEIIAIENKEEMGICAAYNKGAKEAKYPILAFIHEDILFHTKNWGSIIVNIFKDTSIGIVGVAGGTYKSKTISSAWCNGDLFVNILQHKGGKSFHWNTPENYKQTIADVLALDGVFLCLPKNVWKQCPFDEKILHGFHFYDLDISLAIKSKGLRVCVSYDILLEHFSFGQNDKSWYKEAIIIHRKWRNSLPWSICPIGKKKAINFEYAAAAYKLKLALKDPNFSLGDKAQAIFDIVRLRPFRLNTYRIIKQNIIK